MTDGRPLLLHSCVISALLMNFTKILIEFFFVFFSKQHNVITGSIISLTIGVHHIVASHPNKTIFSAPVSNNVHEIEFSKIFQYMYI